MAGVVPLSPHLAAGSAETERLDPTPIGAKHIDLCLKNTDIGRMISMATAARS